MDEAQTAIYLTPISSEVYIPLALGTRHGYDTPGSLFICMKSYLELAICGTHLGDTNDPTSTVFNPLADSMSISLTLSLS